MSSTVPVPTTLDAAVAQLRLQLAGTVHTSADADYDAARATWNLSFAQAPTVVVEPETADDVVVAMRFARATGLHVAVQATGHGLARVADGALLVNTRRLGHVTIDPTTRRARIGAGATWGPILAAAHVHGLAPLLGSAPHVGAVGYTLGGGMGWLARRHGLSADHVIAIELVTADGQIRQVTRETDPDLFWALRGGGAGTLGIVTALEIELVPVHTVVGGNLFYPASMAREVMARFRDWVADVPEDLTAAVAVMSFPPLDVVPEPLRGRQFTIVRGCHAGDPDEAVRLLDHWRRWQAPEIDLFGPMPFTEVAAVSQDPVDPVPGTSTAELLTDLPDDAIDTIVSHTLEVAGPPPLMFTEIRHLGGALDRGDSSATEQLRGARFVTHSVGMTPTPEAAAALDDFLVPMRAALAPHTTGGAYLNFLEGAERRERSVQAFTPEGWQRFRAVKDAVDPDGWFDHGLDTDA